MMTVDGCSRKAKQCGERSVLPQGCEVLLHSTLFPMKRL